MPRGLIRRIPYEVDQFINNLQKAEELPDLKRTFIRLKDYAIVGKEAARMAKTMGIKIVK